LLSLAKLATLQDVGSWKTLVKEARNQRVALYSFHPLVLAELCRLLEESNCQARAHRLEPSRLSALEELTVLPAAAHVVEANARSRATKVIVEEILARRPDARLLVVAERFDDADAFPLLRLGAKGLVRYVELPRYFVAAVREVAAGGFWVPRVLLSRFVDSTLSALRRPKLVSAHSHMSRREQEVHQFLMENLSNKEIANRLHMSERTVKFHVSNLLGKHGVKRRSDLILLSFAERKHA
jgi:two-component system response regulator DevR